MSLSLNNDSPGLNCLSSEGYHHNSVSIAKLLSSGCTQCYMADYRESTKTADIMSCVGPTLFVGSKSTRSLTFLHGSYGPAAIVKASQPTKTSKIHNGVHWHFIENTSFGFSYDLQSISNGDDGIGTIGTIDTDKGVSWTLDAEVAATEGTTRYKKNLNMRNIFNLMPSSEFEKFVYNCPGIYS